MIYSWTLYRMFFEVPSWLYYLSLLDILVLAAHVLVFALFESLFLLGLVALLGLVLPRRFFKEKFIAQGSAVVVWVCLAAVTVQRRLGILYSLQSWQLVVFPLFFLVVSLAMVPVLSYIYERYPVLQRLVESLADRTTVFGYIYAPLSVVSLLVVVFRSLL